MEGILYKLARGLFNLFVANQNVIAMQMPDGNYVPQIINYDFTLFQQMLIKKSSLAVYQQKSFSSQIKWICFDFDILKDKEKEGSIEELVKLMVLPLCKVLDSLDISYLVEFSGRRGIHVWIIFDCFFEKQLGYDLMTEVLDKLNYENRLLEIYAIDRFPATRYGKNKFGKAVKLPLSAHKKNNNKQSFFLTKSDLNSTLINDIDSGKEDINLIKQDKIITNYKKNNISLFQRLKIVENNQTYLKYKTQRFDDIEIDFNELVEKTSDSIVFLKLWDRVQNGCITYLDRLVLVGTFSNFSKDLLIYIFSLQNNFDVEKTEQNIEKLKHSLYPITMFYLYDLYIETLEKHIEGDMTVVEFISKKLGIKPISKTPYINNTKTITHSILEKEKNYFIYNDEIIEPHIFHDLNNIFNYDIERIENRALDIINGKVKWDASQYLDAFYTYIRKENKNGTVRERTLVSLTAIDRLLTTRLSYEFVNLLKWKFDSYSYNINFWSDEFLFFPFYSSWRKYINEISLYLKFDIFDDYSIMKLDLESFYDNIYLHSINDRLIEMIEKKSNQNKEKLIHIFDFLKSYNSTLQNKLNGTTRGVPQGPAYARILAEFFLSTLLRNFFEEYKSINDRAVIRLFRYVDDIFIIYKNIDDGELFLNEINSLFLSVGLNLNEEKTCNFGMIKNLTDGIKESFFDDIYKNYIIQSLDNIDYLSEENQFMVFELFDKFVNSNDEWSIKNANFLLGEHIDTKLLSHYISQNYYDILQSEIGRGSIFYKFYKIVFKDPKRTIDFFKNTDYLKIPRKSLNFKVFLVTLYYELNRVISFSDTMGKEFRDFVDFLKDTKTDDYEQKMINVIFERLSNDN